MGAPERALIDARLRDLAEGERRFRINCGQGWVASKRDTLVRKERDGSITVYLRHARPFHGAPDGWSDLFGWDSVIVTPDMIGNPVAIAAGEEVKAHGGRLSRVQVMFRDCLVRMGGRWRVVTSRPDRPLQETLPRRERA